ncbi:MAG: hypothetical protein C0394_12245 [Syntrophus sp. (in: bacteria)]|nr:hypothetical protein [Syntrophus sp. (in: bacteria)]
MNTEDLDIFQTAEEIDHFWALIDLARADWDAFAAELRTLDGRFLIRFGWTFEELAGDVWTALEESGFAHFKGSVSEDALEDICGWVVAQGFDVLDRSILDPTLIPEWPKGVGISVKYEAATAYHERFGEEPPAY